MSIPEKYKYKYKTRYSKNNHVCITNCVDSSVKYIHPLTYAIITPQSKDATCAIDNMLKNYDTCDNSNGDDNTVDDSTVDNNLIVPTIYFNPILFLNIYDIHKYEDVYVYLQQNAHIHIDTKIRIMNVCLECFGSSINIIDDKLIDFYLDVISSKWKNKLMRELDLDDKKFKQYFNKDEILKFLTRYFNSLKKEWSDIMDHTRTIKHNLVLYYKNKIKLDMQ